MTQTTELATYFIVLVKQLLDELVTLMIELCGAANGNSESDNRRTFRYFNISLTNAEKPNKVKTTWMNRMTDYCNCTGAMTFSV